MQMRYTEEKLNTFSKETLIQLFLAQQEQLSEIDKKLQLVLEQLAVMNQNRYGRKTEQMQGAKALCGCIVPAGEKKKPSFSMNTRKQEKQTIRKSF